MFMLFVCLCFVILIKILYRFLNLSQCKLMPNFEQILECVVYTSSSLGVLIEKDYDVIVLYFFNHV